MNSSPPALVALAVFSSACGVIPNPALLGSAGSQSDMSASGTAAESNSMSSTDYTGTSQANESGDGSDTGDMNECATGVEGCSCTAASDCDPELECIVGVCTDVTICGDGLVEGNEQCDDRNATPADGCEADCSSTRIVAVDTGAQHTCVLTELGHVLCFGLNDSGQLGYDHTQSVGDDENPGSHAAVPLPASAIAISAGGGHTCALLSSRKTLCWGLNSSGQLGRGNVDSIGDDPNEMGSSEPIDLGDTIAGISAGSDFTCATSSIGEVYCWGGNAYGQLGLGHANNIGDNEPISTTNTRVEAGGLVDNIAAGGRHVCVIMSWGGLRCWGYGLYGQLGLGNPNSIGDNEHPVITALKFGDEALGLVATGAYQSFVVRPFTGNEIWGWGRNEQGQLGVGDQIDYGNSVEVDDHVMTSVSGEVVHLAAGNHHTCAIRANDSVACWGPGNHGQLGYGNAEGVGDDELVDSYAALQFPDIPVQLAAGLTHTCALLENGDLYCWGSNAAGQIGHPMVDSVGISERATDVGPVIMFND